MKVPRWAPRWAPRWVLVGLLLHPLAAQGPAAQGPAAQSPAAQDRDFANLLQRLEGKAATPRLETRIQILHQFLSRRARQGDSDSSLLKARLLLGGHYLQHFEAEKALLQFEEVSKSAGRTQRTLRGRAAYGRAQCQELLGDLPAARNTLRLASQEFQDMRYGRLATIALRRLALAKREQLKNGRPAPTFGPILDLTGKSHSLQARHGHARLLVFWSPDSNSSQRFTQRMAKTWKKAGGEARDFLALAVHADQKLVAQIRKQGKWKHPVLVCGGQFLDPVVLSFEVGAVPASYLLGPDGTLLGRDLSSRQIMEAMEGLR